MNLKEKYLSNLESLETGDLIDTYSKKGNLVFYKHITVDGINYGQFINLISKELVTLDQEGCKSLVLCNGANFVERLDNTYLIYSNNNFELTLIEQNVDTINPKNTILKYEINLLGNSQDVNGDTVIKYKAYIIENYKKGMPDYEVFFENETFNNQDEIDMIVGGLKYVFFGDEVNRGFKRIEYKELTSFYKNRYNSFFRIENKEELVELLNDSFSNNREIVIHYNCSECDDEQVSYAEIYDIDRIKDLIRENHLYVTLECTNCGFQEKFLHVDYIQGVEFI